VLNLPFEHFEHPGSHQDISFKVEPAYRLWRINTMNMELFLFLLWIFIMSALGVKLYLAHQALNRAKKKPPRF
jgi:hypothetical protein